MSQSILQSPSVLTERRIFLNLIHQEWQLCRGPVISLAMLWVIGLWVLVLFNHPAWLLAVGMLHAIVVSSAQAGRDVLDGTEEFSFSQPPGRGPLYQARLAIGLVFLLINGVVGGVAIAVDLPQRVWSLVFSGGLTESFGAPSEFFWYGMAVLVPLAAHGVTFALAANAGSRAGVNASWMGGAIAAASLALVGAALENLLWQAPNGVLGCPALLAVGVLVPLVGHQAYLRKEATGSGGVAGRAGSGGGLWIGVILVGLLLLLLLSFFFLRFKTVSSQEHEKLRRAVPSGPVPPLSPAPERDSN